MDTPALRLDNSLLPKYRAEVYSFTPTRALMLLNYLSHIAFKFIRILKPFDTPQISSLFRRVLNCPVLIYQYWSCHKAIGICVRNRCGIKEKEIPLTHN